MSNHELYDRLSLLLLRSSLQNKYATVRLAEVHGLTVMQIMTLCLLDPGKPVPMKNLATFVSCDPSNITGIVEKLVQERLVTRQEAAYDRRVKTVMLTSEGLSLRDELLHKALSSRFPHLSDMSDDEVETLITLLTRATSVDETIDADS